MILKQPTLNHGERYGKLTVLGKVKTAHGWKYRVGCVCGNSRELHNAYRLMKGKVTQCGKCQSTR